MTVFDIKPGGFLLCYFVIISAISAIVTIIDKLKAARGAWRVPERTLLILAAIGGSAAMYITMLLIRHKTKHIKFMLGIPIIMLFQVILILWCNTRFQLF